MSKAGVEPDKYINYGIINEDVSSIRIGEAKKCLQSCSLDKTLLAKYSMTSLESMQSISRAKNTMVKLLLKNSHLIIRLLVPVFSTVAVLIGLMALAGWMWDIDQFKRVYPGLISMNPLTAVLFTVAGVSLWLQRHPGPAHDRPLSRRIARIGAAFIFVVALIKLGSDLGAWGTRVDQILFAHKLAHDQPTRPNQMAPNAAFNFVLLGTALLLMDVRPRQRRWSPEYFTLVILLTSLLALMGYAYRIPTLYEVGAFVPMALHTAVLFQLLALGILFARPHRGLMAVIMSESPGGKLARVLLPSMITAQFVLGWLRIEGERRGYYGAEMGVALYTIANIICFAALIWWNVQSLHRADEARTRIEHERNRFFTLSLDMLCIAGVDGYFKRLSPAFHHTLGYTLDELMARPFLDFIHPDDRESTIAEVAKLQGGVPSEEFLNRYQCRDGSWKWISWTVQPFPEERLLYASGRDVTEKKQRETAINDLNQLLEQRAAQLEDSNRELEAFSYSVSHDLRAPLRHIQGYVDMLTQTTQGQLSEKAGRYLKVITEASSEMAQLIDDLLSFSRMGRTAMKEATVDLNHLVKEALKDQEMALRDRQIEWTIADLPPVKGDASLLRQVMANLIGNAIKYTRERDPAKIEITCTGEQDGQLTFLVRDNGAGFDMRYVHKLFGVFQRLHRAEEFEGTGIGLAIVRRIIARHGGRVWAEGVPKQGATFYFTLFPAPLNLTPLSQAS